ncbi:hypothetical protein AEGHOMDF_4445 [Methylobacterium soli]|nr:hypothetical protein AEGHOMDF_4445 [Methylobacterium soli]
MGLAGLAPAPRAPQDVGPQALRVGAGLALDRLQREVGARQVREGAGADQAAGAAQFPGQLRQVGGVEGFERLQRLGIHQADRREPGRHAGAGGAREAVIDLMLEQLGRRIEEVELDQPIREAAHDLVAPPADRREFLEIEVERHGLDPRESAAALAQEQVVEQRLRLRVQGAARRRVRGARVGAPGHQEGIAPAAGLGVEPRQPGHDAVLGLAPAPGEEEALQAIHGLGRRELARAVAEQGAPQGRLRGDRQGSGLRERRVGGGGHDALPRRLLDPSAQEREPVARQRIPGAARRGGDLAGRGLEVAGLDQGLGHRGAQKALQFVRVAVEDLERPPEGALGGEPAARGGVGVAAPEAGLGIAQQGLAPEDALGRDVAAHQGLRRSGQEHDVALVGHQRIIRRDGFQDGDRLQVEAVCQEAAGQDEAGRAAHRARGRRGRAEKLAQGVADIAAAGDLPGAALEREVADLRHRDLGLARHRRDGEPPLAADRDPFELGADHEVVGLGQNREAEAARQQFEIHEALALGDSGGPPAGAGDHGDPLAIEVEPGRAAGIGQPDPDASGGAGEPRRRQGLARAQALARDEFPPARRLRVADRQEVDQAARRDREAIGHDPARALRLAEHAQAGPAGIRDRDGLAGLEHEGGDVGALEQGHRDRAREGEHHAVPGRACGARRWRLRAARRRRRRGGGWRRRGGGWRCRARGHRGFRVLRLARGGRLGLGDGFRRRVLERHIDREAVLVPVGGGDVALGRHHHDARGLVVGLGGQAGDRRLGAAAGIGRVEPPRARQGDAGRATRPLDLGLHVGGQADREARQRRQVRDLQAQRPRDRRRRRGLEGGLGLLRASGEVGHDLGRKRRRKARPVLRQQVDEDLLAGFLNIDAIGTLQRQAQAAAVGIAPGGRDEGRHLGGEPLGPARGALGVAQDQDRPGQLRPHRHRLVEGQDDAAIVLGLAAAGREQARGLGRREPGREGENQRQRDGGERGANAPCRRAAPARTPSCCESRPHRETPHPRAAGAFTGKRVAGYTTMQRSVPKRG